MATIRARKRKNGKTSYTAQIRLKEDGEVTYSESKTFDEKSLANTWALQREAELRFGGVKAHKDRDASVGDILTWYKDDFDGYSKFGRSKLSCINFLINSSDIASKNAFKLTAGDLVTYVHQRRELGAGPSTVNNDLIWLRNAFRDVAIARDLPISTQPIDDAALLCRRQNLVASAETRDRRPTIEELDKIIDYYESSASSGKFYVLPMVEIVLMALFSSRREGEIVRITWSDLDHERKGVLVRDMKHPTKKINTFVYFPAPAWEVVLRQPNVDGQDLIFPYNSKSISSSFTRTCKVLGIEDLRFHDLRHECVSWMFELGWEIPRVVSVSGHRSWASLQRYTHLSQREIHDKYANWIRTPK